MRYTVYSNGNLILDTQNENFKIFNPKVDLELNKTGSLTFTIYPDNPNFNSLQKLKSIITVYQDNYLLFRGRILDEEEGFHNEKQVICEGELAFLLDSIQRPYAFHGDTFTTVSELFTYYITNHNSQVDADHQFTVGNITVMDANNYVARSDSTYLNTWDSINQKLIRSYGGYLWVRHEDGVNYIDFLADFSSISSQKIEFGKNLLDVKKITKGEDIATAIIPLGAKLENSEQRLTIESVNDGVDYVFNQDAVNSYGWIFKTAIWDDVTVASNLLNKANDFLATAILSDVSIDLTAADLSKTGQDVSAFHMGVYIPVSSTFHNLDANFLVNKLSINLLDPKSDKLTLGTSCKTLTEQSQSLSNALVAERVERTQTMNSAIAEVREETVSLISQASDSILSSVYENYYTIGDTDAIVNILGTEFEQTKEAFNFTFNALFKDIDDVQAGTEAEFTAWRRYIRFEDGNIILGKKGNELILKIQNDRISFLNLNVEVAYFSNRKLYVTDGEYLRSLKIGNFSFIPRENGNLSFKI